MKIRKELTRGKGVKVSCQKSGQRKNPEKSTFFEVSEEAQTGFEPVRTGVADHCLTAWLLRHILMEMTPTGIEPVLPP